MSDAFIDRISSAIRETVYHGTDEDGRLRTFHTMILNLRVLKTFVICSKKLHWDASLKQFLAQIEEKLKWEGGMMIDCYVPKLSYFWFSPGTRFGDLIHSFGDEMDKWYVAMLESIYTPDSISLMTIEIFEVINSILESMSSFPEHIDGTCFDGFDPLKVQLMFLRSLIPFVAKGSTEFRKDLLAHCQDIALNAAYLVFLSARISSPGYPQVVPGVTTLAQKMKPIDPQVYEMYTQSLIGSKLSQQMLDDDAIFAVEILLDALVSNLKDIIWHTCHMNWMKSQLQELYERLRSLKIIIEQQPIANFDIEIQQEIVDAVTDAGISVCSLYQAQIDVNSGHQHLLDKLEIILSKTGETVSQTPTFNSTRTSSYGFVDCMLEKLMELASSEDESISKIHVALASIRSSFGMFRDEQTELQTLWDRLLEVAFKIESVVDYQVVAPLSDSFSTSFDSIMKDIGCIEEDLLKIEVKEFRSGTFSHLPSQTAPLGSTEVIGFQDEERIVLDWLRRGSQHLRLIAIVGMPGLGKTTLATKVYNHSSLSYYFSAKAWCSVSQVLDKENIFLDLLKQICPDMSFKMSEHDLEESSMQREHKLADKLRRSLKGKRYLIFLDDIWNTEAWDKLKDSFPDDNKGSRIIFTSRSLNVAPPEMCDQEPLVLSPLSEEDSLSLMCSKLFPGLGYSSLPPGLHGLEMQILARCKGLPLAIIIVAGVLANAKTEAWEAILDSFNFLSCENYSRYTLEFSYRHLPDYLRPCFLYFGMFPEDEEVSVRRLLRLWIAEGFVRKSETSSLEDVAEGYLKMLIDRSLITAGKQRSDGGVKTCRIHDLLRDFCLDKAKDERLFHFAKQSDELYSINEPPNLRRILIDFKSEPLNESKMYCPHARSLLMRGLGEFYEGLSSSLQFFKLLKVLNLEQIDFGNTFPPAIEQLVLLSFLAMKGRNFNIPSWLANLSNLETLVIRFRAHHFSLPDNLWRMQKLKFLCIQSFGDHGNGGELPVHNLDDSFILYELDRFTGALIDWCNMEKQLRKFPNIRKLKCTLEIAGKGEYVDKFAFPEFSSKLESLDMCGRQHLDFGVRFEFSALTNLKKLKLCELSLCWEIFSVIGNQLPSLEVLKLHRLDFKDEKEYTWEMKMGEFSKLRVLHLNRMPIRRWIACDDHEFECFQKLVLISCEDLVELPSCLEYIETLEAIEVSYYSEAIGDLVTQVEVAQNNWGNSVLKITRNHLHEQYSYNIVSIGSRLLMQVQVSRDENE